MPAIKMHVMHSEARLISLLFIQKEKENVEEGKNLSKTNGGRKTKKKEGLELRGKKETYGTNSSESEKKERGRRKVISSRERRNFCIWRGWIQGLVWSGLASRKIRNNPDFPSRDF